VPARRLDVLGVRVQSLDGVGVAGAEGGREFAVAAPQVDETTSPPVTPVASRISRAWARAGTMFGFSAAVALPETKPKSTIATD